MTYILCKKCKIRMSFIEGDVLMKWDQHETITDYTRFAKAEIHVCDNCDCQIVMFKSVNESEMICFKDLGMYRENNWKILEFNWDYQ